MHEPASEASYLSKVVGQILKFSCSYGVRLATLNAMMINVFRRFVVFIALFSALPLFAAPRAEHVFIISIDGGNPDEIQHSKMPVLKKLVKEGPRA